MSALTPEDREALDIAVDEAETCLCCGDTYGWRHIIATVERIVAEKVAPAKAEALREAASDPALRLSGHSGVSVRALRDRADLIEGQR